MSEREGLCCTVQNQSLPVKLRGGAAFNSALRPTPRPPCPLLLPTNLRAAASVRRVRRVLRERLRPQFRSDALARESRGCAFIESAAARACKCNAHCQVFELMQPSQLLGPYPPPFRIFTSIDRFCFAFIVRTVETSDVRIEHMSTVHVWAVNILCDAATGGVVRRASCVTWFRVVV